MYVCICNAIKEAELRHAALRTDGDAEAVYLSLGRIPQCAQCLEQAESILADARRAHTLPVRLSA